MSTTEELRNLYSPQQQDKLDKVMAGMKAQPEPENVSGDEQAEVSSLS